MIGKLNRFFTRHGKLAFFVILLAVGIPFILMDVMPRGGGFGTENVLAEVNGEDVKRDAFMKHLYGMELQQILSRPNSGMLQIDIQTMQMLAPEVFRRIHMLQEASERGLDAVSAKEIAARIQQYPMFMNQETGNFDKTQYDNFKKGYLAHRGMSDADFQGILRDEIVLERLISPIVDGLTINELELGADSIERDVEASVKVARLGYWDVVAERPSDSEVMAYYEEHKDSTFLIDEQKQLLVLFARGGDFIESTEVTDTEVEAYYAENQEEFKRTEMEVSHILIRTDADDSAELRAEKRKQAQALLQQIKDGGDFEALAREFSEERLSAQQGGSLGFIAPERRPDFAPQLLDHEKGVVYPELLPSRFGFHIAKRGDTREAVKPLQEVAGTIRVQLGQDKDDALYADEARKRFEEGKETLYTPRDEVHLAHILISAPRNAPEEERAAAREEAEALLAQIKEGADFAELAREHSDDRGSAQNDGALGWYEPSGFVPEFAEAGKALEAGAVSDLVETQFGYHIIKKLEADRVQETTFEDIRESLVGEIRRERRDEANAQAQQLVADFQERLLSNEALYQARGVEQTEIFRVMAEAYLAEHEGRVHLRESGYFDADSSFVPGISMGSGKLKEAAERLTPARRITMKVVDDGNAFMTAALNDLRSPRVPAFADIQAQVRTALSEERETAVARENMRRYRDQLAAAMEEGMSLEEATAKVNEDFAFNLEFVSLEPFPLSSQPDANEARMNDAAGVIAEVARQTPAGQLSGATDSPSGALIVYVEEVTVEKTPIEPQMRMFMEYQYRSQLMQAAMEAYRERMQADAEYYYLVEWLQPDAPGTPEDTLGY